MENVGTVIEPMVSAVSWVVEPAVGVTQAVAETASESVGAGMNFVEPTVDAAFAMASEVHPMEGLSQSSEEFVQHSAKLAFVRRQMRGVTAVTSELTDSGEESEEVVAVLVEEKKNKKAVALGFITGLIAKIAGFVSSTISQA